MRRGRLVSKKYVSERGQNIVVVLQARRVMATQVSGVTKLGHAVNAAAFFLYLAHWRSSGCDVRSCFVLKLFSPLGKTDAPFLDP